jgi:phage gp16-like protein
MTTLTMKDEKRLDVIQRVHRRELTVVEAARVMGLSERKCYRVKVRENKHGAKGVVHGNRRRLCKRKRKGKTHRPPLELARKNKMVLGHTERHGAIPQLFPKCFHSNLTEP